MASARMKDKDITEIWYQKRFANISTIVTREKGGRMISQDKV